MTSASQEQEKSRQTLVVNLYGGPGTGKSTTAAGLFSLLKQNGCNCELALEYAKDVVWEGRTSLFSDQVYIFAKQNRRLGRLYGKVDVIVTDCPLMLSYYYSGNDHLLALIQQETAKADQLHIMLERVKPYVAAGRYQSEDDARNIDTGVRTMLDDLKIPYHKIKADSEAPQAILPLIASAKTWNRLSRRLTS